MDKEAAEKVNNLTSADSGRLGNSSPAGSFFLHILSGGGPKRSWPTCLYSPSNFLKGRRKMNLIDLIQLGVILWIARWAYRVLKYQNLDGRKDE